MISFIQKFQEITHLYPNNIAIQIDGRDDITYKELFQQSKMMALLLKKIGVKKDEVVGIHLEKSIDYIISLLAIWINNSVFMPLIPELPEERKKFIVSDSQLKYVITSHKNENKDLQNLKKIYIENKNEFQNTHRNLSYPQSEDNAYLIYTSGSTGKPKGVLVTHAGIENIISQQIQYFNISQESHILFFISLNFDASLSDIGVTLLSGACLHIENIDKKQFIIQLADIIKKRHITHIDIPPSLLGILEPKTLPPCLRTIIIGGEVCSIETIKKYTEMFEVINVYGPTESTICTSMVKCNSQNFKEAEIGSVIEGVKYILLDKDNTIILGNGEGELFIGGVGLAKGYINNEVLNKRKFVKINSERFYKTGDYVERKDDTYIFRCRIDRQIKIKGQLVELEEIESVIMSHKKVSNTAVIIKNSTLTKKKILAFICLKTGENIGENEIENYLKMQLCSWMIPSEIIYINELPLNINGKIDYKSLSEYGSKNHKKLFIYEDIITEKLLNIWRQVLGKNEIGPDDEFLKLGGDSLDIVEIVVSANKNGINLPLEIVVEEQTIRKIIKRIYNREKNNINSSEIHKLEEKSHLDHDLCKIIKKSYHLPINEKKDFLITGSRGFLGVRVLKNILDKEKNRKIYLIIRSQDTLSAQSTLIQSAKKQNIYFSSEEMNRIRIFCGDIGKKNFGLSHQEWNELGKNISDIIHLAAEVNAIKSYKELECSNVEGMKEVIKLALYKNKKTIHYSSTLSVFVATDKDTGVVFENDTLSDTKVIYGGYAQSKWVAERILHKIPKNLVNINIFRLGLITGDSDSGIYSDHDYLEMFIKGEISLQKVPKGNHRNIYLDVTPVDYASDIITDLILKIDGSGVYHIANKKGFSSRQILKVLKNEGIKIDEIPKNQWLTYIKNKKLTQNESATIMGLCRFIPIQDAFENLRTMDLFQSTNIQFDQTNLNIALQKIGRRLIIPSPNNDLLRKYIRLILKNNVKK